MDIKVAKNASWIICCKIVQAIISLIISMLSARYLGPYNYGTLNYVASVVAFAFPIVQLGFGKTIVRELVNEPEKEGKVLGTAFCFNSISAIIGMIVVSGFFVVTNENDKITIIAGSLYSLSLFFQVFELFQYWFQAKLMSKYISIASMVSYVVVASYKIFLLVTQKSILWFVLISTINYAVVSLVLFLFYKHKKGPRLGLSFTLGFKMLKRSKYYIISSMMVTIFAQTDRIMLKMMISDEETGYYSAAIACINIASFIYIAIIDSMRPVILENKLKDESKYRASIIELYSLITLFSCAQSILTTIFAKQVILILYGINFEKSIVPLMIAVWYVSFSYFGNVRNIWILAEEKQNVLWVINLIGAISNILLNYLLIPPLGATGAAIASLITQVVANFVLGFILPSIRENNRLLIHGCNPKIAMVSLLSLAKERR